MALAIFLLWMKSYVVMRLVFDLPLENFVEEFILFISPLSSLLLIFGFARMFFSNMNIRGTIIVSSFATILLYINLVYYRFFNDFITVPVLFQVSNFGDLGGSALGLMRVWDLLLFLDIVLLYVLSKKGKFTKFDKIKSRKRFLFGFAIVLLVFNVMLAETQRPQLLTRIFDRQMLVKYLGVYNYQAFDLFIHSKTSAQRTFAESDDLVEVENYVKQKHTKDHELTGIAKGKNIILISMESLQNFVINYKVNGEEVTPFLNDLIESSFYFDNFYHQTGQGKTSDSEFLLANSLYPLSRGAVFTTHADNKYYALPKILKEHGYTTASFHGNNKSFWNRDVMYQSLGYDHYFSERYYDVNEENSVNYGLKDIPFFEQSIPKLQSLQEPFYAKFITLTNHYPYTLDPEDKMIEPTQTGDGSVDRYFQTVRYFDEALKLFFEQLKETGIYEDSIFVLYGDHYGISANHNRAMSEIMGREITPYEHVQLQKVPLYIHIPGMEGETVHTVSGQIDLRPTILNLLGIDNHDMIRFGEDLFAPDKEEFVVFLDGSFVTDKYLFTQGKCYQKGLKLEIESSLCEDDKLKAERELNLSNKIIQRDLLRFYKEN